MTTYVTDGAYGELTIAADVRAPWYIITFDAEGQCTSPQARASLLAATRGGFDHIIVFSHGWNNIWDEVESLNRNLVAALASVWTRADWPRPSRVLVASVFWPSVSVLAEDERGPTIAAGEDADRQALDALAAALPPAQAGRLRELAAQGDLGPAEAEEFAALLASLLAGDDDVEAPPPSAADLLAMARSAEGPAPQPHGIVDPKVDVWGEIGGGPESAGTLDQISWRTPVRVASVFAMKRRAGVVGARGVAPLLRNLLESAGTAAVHLAGHSYGCRVMLSALCAEPFERQAASLLLLQPAVSRYCFAEQVPTTGRRGGYSAALARVRQPILTTFSDHDGPLHKWFSLAMALAKDVGEPDIAGPFDNIYAALGGYGPAGVDFAELKVQAPGSAYPLGGGKRILALDGSVRVGDDRKPAIDGHGDVTSRYTGWMLYNQLRHAREVAP
ncbi:MAG: hypothetical protein HGA45_06750 [Chloroflexales bacterium]|nr:hypothetical protein [Chloroflexales bacterium]